MAGHYGRKVKNTDDKKRLKVCHINSFESQHHLTVNPLLHRPGKARRGDKVSIHFQLQGWFTSTSRQSPQVDKESDQSTVKEFDQ